jgi:anti-anti-sigma factor
MAGSLPGRTQFAPCDRLVLAMAGEVDLATAPQLRSLLEEADHETTREVVLDLSDVTYMDCAGLTPMLAARARLGDRFWLRGVPPPVTRLLQLTGLREVFAILPQDEIPAHGTRLG